MNSSINNPHGGEEKGRIYEGDFLEEEENMWGLKRNSSERNAKPSVGRSFQKKIAQNEERPNGCGAMTGGKT